MPYATGETPQIGDVVERVREPGDSEFWSQHRIVMDFDATNLSLDGDPAGGWLCWHINKFRLIRRKTDITKLDTSGVFDEAKPASEAVRRPRRAINAGNRHIGDGWAQQNKPGQSWSCYYGNGFLFRAAQWSAEQGERFIADGIWVELTDHHATAAQLPAHFSAAGPSPFDGPQVKEAAATEAKDGEWPKSFYHQTCHTKILTFRNEKDVQRSQSGILWSYEEMTPKNFWLPCPAPSPSPSPELAAARDEIERLKQERDYIKAKLSAARAALNT